jgi:hypothetical protein
MSAYFSELLPAAKRDLFDAVAVCESRTDEGAPDWFATVHLSDESLYHYRLYLPTPPEAPETQVHLEFFSTRAMRDDEADHGSRRRGCFGAAEDYRFEVGGTITGYVLTSTTIHLPFDDDVKLRLKRAAQAVGTATEAHKKFVPVQETWGIKP